MIAQNTRTRCSGARNGQLCEVAPVAPQAVTLDLEPSPALPSLQLNSSSLVTCLIETQDGATISRLSIEKVPYEREHLL
jgi:hypothetical protein